MKLITETSYDIEIFESSKEKEVTKIAGIFSEADTMVSNGRKYPKDLLEREVTKLNEGDIPNKTSFGELQHPNSPELNLDRVCILVEDLTWKGSQVWGVAKVLDTPMGKIVKELVKEGKVGISSRGLGTVDEETKTVNEDFKLLRYDIVGNPSVNTAWVNGIYEDKEFEVRDSQKTIDELIKEAYEKSTGTDISALNYLKDINEQEARDFLKKQLNFFK